MNNIQLIIEHARLGDASHTQTIFNYLLSFRHVILRGAGSFGTAFGAFLLKHGIPRESIVYWDIRAHEYLSINGIPVLLPMQDLPGNPETTLYIHCIPNGSLSGSAGEREARSSGFGHYLSGMALFEALMCPLHGGSIFDPSICTEITFCNWCACKRLSSLLVESLEGNNPGMARRKHKLVYGVATFVVNQKCTLACADCGQYINHYAREDQINFPLQRIKTDIDRIMDAVDAIGYVSLIGGESFLHPHLNQIVEHILSKPNLGVLGITTNGICQINNTHLQAMSNRRTRIIFSDYTFALDEKKRALFQRNVRKVAEAGISYTVGQPLWCKPSSLLESQLDFATMRRMKTSCIATKTAKTIQNGVYYPCSVTAALGSHRIRNYANDWVVLDEFPSAEALRERLITVDQQAYYQSCRHCGDGGELLPYPGEQGISKRYFHIGKS